MKSLSLMAIIVFSRLGGIFLLFVLLARVVSVEDFGKFVIAYSISAVLVLIVDYGFAQSLLKEIGSNQNAASERLTTGLASKVLLGIIAFAAAFCIIFFYYGNLRLGSLFLLLFSSAIFNSFAEYFGAAMRSIGKYGEEAVVQFVLTLILLGGVYYGGGNGFEVVDFAALMTIIKLIQLVIVGSIAVKSIGVDRRHFTLTSVKTDLRRGMPYAADQGVSNFLMNVDVLIVGAVLGVYATGIYQAGQKLVQGYSASALIISNVFLPRLARNATTTEGRWAHEAKRVGLLMVVTGCFGGGILIALPEDLVLLVYGAKFIELSEILPLFGVLILMRFASGAFGLLLTSIGLQTVRLIANILSLFIVVISALFLLPKFGINGMLYAQLLAVMALLFAYSTALYRKVLM